MSNAVREGLRRVGLTLWGSVPLIALANGFVGCGPDEFLLGTKTSPDQGQSSAADAGVSRGGPNALPREAGAGLAGSSWGGAPVVEAPDASGAGALDDSPTAVPTQSNSVGEPTRPTPSTTGINTSGVPVAVPTTTALPEPTDPISMMVDPDVYPEPSTSSSMVESPEPIPPEGEPLPAGEPVVDESLFAQDAASCELVGAEIDERIAQSSVSIALPLLTGRWTPTPGSDPMLLDLRDDGTGTFTFGEPTTFPPIADPAAAYLLDLVPVQEGVASFLEMSPLPGFTYPVRVVRGAGSGGTLEYFPTEPWREWCQLQAPRRGDYCYACDFVLGGGSRHGSAGDEVCAVSSEATQGQGIPIDCGRWDLCGSASVCECTSTACDLNRSSPVSVTIAIDPLDTTLLQVSTLEWPTNYLVREQSAEQ